MKAQDACLVTTVKLQRTPELATLTAAVSLTSVIYRGSNTEGEGRRNFLWLNDGLGVFSDVTSTNMPVNVNSTFDIELADVDILTAENIGITGDGLVRAYANDGNGLFSEQTT